MKLSYNKLYTNLIAFGAFLFFAALAVVSLQTMRDLWDWLLTFHANKKELSHLIVSYMKLILLAIYVALNSDQSSLC